MTENSELRSQNVAQNETVKLLQILAIGIQEKTNWFWTKQPMLSGSKKVHNLQQQCRSWQPSELENVHALTE